jgi:hypothetical protein
LVLDQGKKMHKGQQQDIPFPIFLFTGLLADWTVYLRHVHLGRDFGNPVRLRLESKTKEDYIRGVGVLCPSIHTKQVPTHPHSHK